MAKVRRDAEVGRIVSFSDGVFAVAATLLVFQLRIPDVPHSEVRSRLPQALRDDIPSIASFALSFVIVGQYWIRHHSIFSHIRRHDDLLLWLNIAFLLCISFIPFPTALLAKYGDQQLVVIIYAASAGLTGLVLTALWRYATAGARLIDPAIDPRLVAYTLLRALITSGVFLVSIAITFVSVPAAEAVWGLVWLTFIVLHRVYHAQAIEEDREAAEQPS